MLQWLKKEQRILRQNPFLLVGLVLLLLLRVGIQLYNLNLLHSSSGCKPHETAHVGLEGLIYQVAIEHAKPAGDSKFVGLVTINENNEPLNVINNVCDNRLFLADLVHELDSLGAKVIAIDQSYSEGSCNMPAANAAFSTALEHAGKPVIVGQRVHERPSSSEDGDCLVENPKFNFMANTIGDTPPAHDNVSFGLLRLNSDLRKIPLFWWVFPNDAASKANALAQKKDGFALTVATRAGLASDDPSLKPFIDRYEHPYTSFVRPPPAWTAMDLLCYGPDTIAARHPEWGACTNINHKRFDFAGKIMVVGDQIDSDKKEINGETYGMELHAQYIESLLAHNYVGTAPWYLDDSAIGVFVILVVLCEAVSVRKAADGSDILDPIRLAQLLTLAVFILGLSGYLILWRAHLFMPNFLLAFVAMALSLIGTVFTAFLTALSKGYPLRKKVIR